MDCLSDEDAAADGFATCAGLVEALSELYPDHAIDGKQWFLVRFALLEPAQQRTAP